MTPEQEARRIKARRLHGQGWTYAAIGREIGVSPVTVRKYCQGLGLPDNPESRRGRSESVRNPQNNDLALLPERDAAFRMLISGVSYNMVAARLGRDRRTIRRWVDEEIQSRLAPQVEKLRVIANARLDWLRQQAWDVVENSTGLLKLQAIDRVLNVERRAAAVNGWDSPVRVEATMTERSSADLELEELLREAQARNAVIEAQIIDSGTDDPT